MRKMKPLKFGIIGCSRIAKRSVIPSIIKSEFAELEIIGSRSTDKAKKFASEFNCEKFGTYEDVISDCLLYTSPSPRDKRQSRMPSSA